jgi:predicted permease
LNDLLQDIRYGVRTLAHNPGFTAVALLILILGIGANSTLFTLVNSTFLQDPPLIESPEELVSFLMIDERVTRDSIGYPDYEWFRDESESFAGILAYTPDSEAIAVGGGDEVAQADAWVVSGNYFNVLGVEMAHGRAFAPEESVTPNTHPVAVISDGFWKRYFGADPDMVGRTLRINGSPFTVIGVTPAGLRGISPTETPPDVYVPIMMQGAIMPGSEDWLVRRPDNIIIWLRMVGRLAPGVDLDTAQANTAVLFSQWESEFAVWLESIDYEPGSTRMALTTRYKFAPRTGDELTRLLTLLFMVVGVVLLIAVANLSILLLARASARQREVSIRAALGAGRARLVRQLLTESCLLALMGGIGGLVLTFWSARLAATLLPMTFAVDFQPDAKVAAFTAGISVLTALLFGLAPALQLARSNIVAFMRRGSDRGARASMRNVLVVAQVALSIVLVTGAGLFVRSLMSARDVDLGFDPANKLAVSVQLGNYGYDEVSGNQFVVSMLDRLSGVPGAEAATTSWHTPFRGRWTSRINAPGTDYADDDHPLDSGFNRVGPGYFELMGIPLVAGREFTRADNASAPLVVVVNEALAEHLWPGENAVGKIIERGDTKAPVIGVAANANYYDVGEEPELQVYVAQLQLYDSRVTFFVRTRAAPLALVPAIEEQFRSQDPNIALSNVRTIESVIDSELAPYRVMAILVSLFGALALFLASVGLYGVQSYLVAGRTREIGIRMALGAEQKQVAGAVLRRSLLLAVIGIIVGVAASLGLARLVQGMLYGISERDPLTFVSVPLVLLAAALLATFLPARRASRVDPMVALREE